MNSHDSGLSNELIHSLFAKVQEQIDLLQQLILFIPPEKLHWAPSKNTFRVCDLLGHLLETLAGFCAALYALRPEQLAHFMSLKDLPVNHCCGIEEAKNRISEYKACIVDGSSLLYDDELSKVIPTLFSEKGETVLTLLLGNLEHLLNHKFQLFFYLKLLDVTVSSKDLYQFRCD